MNATRTAVAALILLGLTASLASAASPEGYATRITNNGTPVIYHHASTYTEGALRGWADLWRGMGDYNYNTSLALINREIARSRHLDNRQKYARTYFDLRRLNREARAYERGPRKTTEEIARYLRKPAAARLTPAELNPQTGAIRGPALLQHEAFAAERELLENLFTAQIVAGGPVSEHQLVTRQVLKQMSAKVSSYSNQLEFKDYIAAKRFLKSLEAESTSPQAIQGLASN